MSILVGSPPRREERQEPRRGRWVAVGESDSSGWLGVSIHVSKSGEYSTIVRGVVKGVFLGVVCVARRGAWLTLTGGVVNLQMSCWIIALSQ